MKFIILIVLLVGCTSKQPSQEDIDAAAERQLAEKSTCEQVAKLLKLNGEIVNDMGNKYCFVLEPIGSRPGIVFSFDDLRAILRFEKIKSRL